MFKRSAFFLLLATGLIHQTANAVPCGAEHRVQSGDSLSILSDIDIHYGAAKFWDVLYQANKDRIGNNPNLIYPGVLLRIPCIDEDGNILPGQFDEDGNPIPEAFDGSRTGGQAHNHDHSADAEEPAEVAEAEPEAEAEPVAQAEPASSEATEVAVAAPAVTAGPTRLLTGDDYGLSADRSISNGRVVSKIIDAALNEDGDKNHQINWINDWSAHLNPLLSSHAFDIGFPWTKPDCTSSTTDKRCSDFLYTNPVFEVWMLLFTNSESPISFENDADLEGKTLCRPSGYQTDDLDANGRNWLADGKVTLKQPASVQQCFRMLVNKDVDAVVVNEFTGRSVVKSLSIQDKVTILDSKPVSIENLYAVVHKDHPRAQQLIDEVNDGVQAIQASGTYQDILASNK